MWKNKHMWSMTTSWQVTRIFKYTAIPWRLPLPVCRLFQADTSSLPLPLNAVQDHVSQMEIKVDASSTLEASALSPTKTCLFLLYCPHVSWFLSLISFFSLVPMAGFSALSTVSNTASRLQTFCTPVFRTMAYESSLNLFPIQWACVYC